KGMDRVARMNRNDLPPLLTSDGIQFCPCSVTLVDGNRKCKWKFCFTRLKLNLSKVDRMWKANFVPGIRGLRLFSAPAFMRKSIPGIPSGAYSLQCGTTGCDLPRIK